MADRFIESTESDEDRDLRQQEHEESVALDGMRKRSDSYVLAKSPEQREEIWNSFSDEERVELESLGLGAPIDVALDEEWKPVEPNDPNFARATEEAWEALWSGRDKIRNGRLFVSSALAARIEEIARQVGGMPKEMGSKAAQEAAHLLSEADRALRDQEPLGRVHSRQETPTPDGGIDLVEKDQRGRIIREVHYSPELLEQGRQQQEAAALQAVRPWRELDNAGNEVTRSVDLSDVSSWEPAQIDLFRREEPALYADLMENRAQPNDRQRNAPYGGV